jgi:sarcosine oxidase
VKSYDYDVIVIGVGSMGSAACYSLASRGYNVLGIEQFHSPHNQGSHSGQSRIIRKAYFEHPDYVPLLDKAYANWTELEHATGEQVYFKTGLLYLASATHPIIEGVKNSAALHSINVEEFSPASNPYYQFNARDGDTIILEREAGFLLPDKIIALYIKQAIKSGAEIVTNEKVINWKKHNGAIHVVTNKGKYSAKKIVITAGAWSDKIIPALPVNLSVTRQLLVWIKPDVTEPYLPENFPCWMIGAPDDRGVYYGFPFLDAKYAPAPAGIKFGLHYPGKITDPGEVDRKIAEEEILALINEAGKFLPVIKNEVIASTTCLYTNSPDENFIIDQLPGYDGDVVVAAGFSGHGFKFVSVVGDILADLVLNGRSSLPISFLSLNRFLSHRQQEVPH